MPTPQERQAIEAILRDPASAVEGICLLLDKVSEESSEDTRRVDYLSALLNNHNDRTRVCCNLSGNGWAIADHGRIWAETLREAIDKAMFQTQMDTLVASFSVPNQPGRTEEREEG